MVLRLSRTTTALAARWPRFEPPLPLFIPQLICAHHILQPLPAHINIAVLAHTHWSDLDTYGMSSPRRTRAIYMMRNKALVAHSYAAADQS